MNPSCYGYVNETHKEMEAKGIKYTQDCKTCPLLEDCVAFYNARSYGGPWEDDSLDLDKEELLTESLFEDDDEE